MRIIISPAKKMSPDTDGPRPLTKPLFLDRATELYRLLQAMDYQTLKALWACNDIIARLGERRLQDYDPQKAQTPALFAYDGPQYRHMAPRVFTDGQLDYVGGRLFVLSGLYGLLRPFDGVIPYRLELQAKLSGPGFGSLYQFWGDGPASALFSAGEPVVNLASKEYSSLVLPYAPKDAAVYTCVFGSLKEGRVVENGAQCKMARGAMVRFLAENAVDDPKELPGFSQLGYRYRPELSTEFTLTFIKGGNNDA